MMSHKLHRARKMLTQAEIKRGVKPYNSQAWLIHENAQIAKVQRKIAKERARIADKKEATK